MPLAEAASNPLWMNLAIFVAAGVIVWFAGVRLTRNLDVIAGRQRLSGVFVGMLLLGGITSLPEVANVATASLAGNPALAVNNLLGSAAINVLLLAVADAWIGREAVTGMVVRPSTMMMATLCMLVLVAVALAVTVGDVEVMGLGVGSLAICALSIGAFRLATGYDRRSPWTLDDEEDAERRAKDDGDDPRKLSRLWLIVAIYGALIFAAGFT